MAHDQYSMISKIKKEIHILLYNFLTMVKIQFFFFLGFLKLQDQLSTL